jgi:hypothetical protein
VVPCKPAEFANELAKRWGARYPDAIRAEEKFSPPPPEAMPDGAIFLSYAREDELAVIRLKAALEKAGCVVWYDRERLKPGVYWPDELKNAVLKRCSLFVSVVSQTTQNAIERYFHRERAWAADRALGFAPGEKFYIPVIIDDADSRLRGEPAEVRQRQATKAFGDSPPDVLVEELKNIQQRRLEGLQLVS